MGGTMRNPGVSGNVSLKEAAQQLGISPFTLRAWAVYAGRLPFYRLGRRIVFAVADLDRFLAASRIPARDEDTHGPRGGSA